MSQSAKQLLDIISKALPLFNHPMKVSSAFQVFGCLCLISATQPADAQNIDETIEALNVRLVQHHEKAQKLQQEIDSLKLVLSIQDMERLGWPTVDTVIKHSAYALAYSEEHEQAMWVMHQILPDVVEGRTSRTNDFRPDPLIDSGSAVEQDYFLKTKKPDGKYEYDGFGFDRGHLAPSADFRWNQHALSESYFYSNMSPQRPDFNRGAWADLEVKIRGYIHRNRTTLTVVTGPVLDDNLPVIARSVNQVSVPKQYFKVVVDLEGEQGIAYLMPNRKIDNPIGSFARSIDEIEALTGFDFFPEMDPNLERRIESNRDYKPWLSEEEQGDVLPMDPAKLKPNHFNTVQAKMHVNDGRVVNVCGTVVSGTRSGKGHVFLNLDKPFPNQIFSVSIWSDNLVNFSYAPEKELLQKEVCVKGKIRSNDGTPSMNVVNEKAISLLGEF